ncbi:hypothetical protein DFH29DRAFT_1015261 [Suillus ampliporus]|nr:hypothetical protein DFH29DRAFT_1015261 [Suillus ampliporus]
MPIARQRVRRSARLRANARGCPTTMDPPESISEERPNPPPEASGPRMSIQWQSELALTDILVNYLTTHPSDCRILFYSEGKKKMASIDDNPSGRDKGDIHGTIAHLIFADHIKYGPAYRHNQKKFRDSVSSHISGFTATGAGVMPLDGASVENLLFCTDLPWYTDLNVIWHGNPAMAVKMHSSKLGVDHTAALYLLVRPSGGAGPSMHFGAATGAGPPNAHLPPNAYPSSSAHSAPNAYPSSSTHSAPNAYPPPNAYPSSSAHSAPNAYPSSSAHSAPNTYPPPAHIRPPVHIRRPAHIHCPAHIRTPTHIHPPMHIPPPPNAYSLPQHISSCSPSWAQQFPGVMHGMQLIP